MKTILFSFLCIFTVLLSSAFSANFDRNKAVPVEQVLFGKVQSVRNITERELIEDKNQGWKTFGGALVGGAIGSQLGSGSGQNIATVLGALLGGSFSHNNNPQYHIKTIHLVELMIITDKREAFMVIQDLDPRMVFQRNDAIRLIYLANGSVRIDKQM
jgi:outer membrane lipoprotein SlyB|tara:strand:+ start:81 stop:554 length:474 start_codon:yes stop_codon:yes gene_type:complete